MNSRNPTAGEFAIRVRSAQTKEIIKEIRGTCGNPRDLDALASDIWNDGFCLGVSFGLRVYRLLGHPLRWRKVDQLGFW